VKLYADRPTRVVRQIFVDLFIAAWVVAWIWAAMELYDLVQKLAAPGRELETAATNLGNNLADAGGKVGRIPLVGDELTAPFTGAANAAKAAADAGHRSQELIGDLALWLSISLLVFPLGLVILVWLPLRIRWIQRATAAAALRSQPAGQDLLALRALVTQPLRRLSRLDSDVASKWRTADPATLEALAALELRTLGLRAKSLPGGASA
jgi:hypothetical protein